MTFIEDARTMLADLLLPIPFWAEAVNTACYVHNRVLVTKPHNKTPYELLHGRTPSIGFMRPFGCPVTIFNTLDSLGKFKGKIDEGFLVGYSVNSKDFRVFNNRTREEVDQQYVLFLVWSSGFTNPQNYDGDATIDDKEHDFDVKKPESEVILSPSSIAQSRKQDDKTKKEAKGKSPVESVIGYRDLNAEFEDCFNNSSNEVNAAGSIALTVGQNSFNNTNTFSAAELKDITYSDDENAVGVEADFNNLETSITVSLIPTTRIHKDHHVSQIIGDLSLTTQTRSMTRVVKDQGGLSQMFNDDFHTWFEDPDHPDKVYKVVKALYGLHQAPRACQDKYVAEILRKFGLIEGKSASTPIDTEKPLLKDHDSEDVHVHTYRSMIGSIMYLTSSRPDIMFAYPKDSPFELVAYSDSDYAGASLDIKYTTGGCQFLGCRLISWQYKKQIVVATSSTEAEYIAAASCCAQTDASEGFTQVIDFLNGSYIKYALTINPDIYVSCIKQFWNTAAIKQVNDVTRLQALVDKKKMVITEDAIREVLRLDDVERVDCLPNEEIFVELARMGYEKPSTKLTFYKAFFSSQWKFLIYAILQSLSAKRTSWNEFSSAMVSAVICLSTGKGFLGVETPLFEGMLVKQVIEEGGDPKEHVEADTTAQGDDTTAHGDDAQEPSIPSPTPPTPPPQPPQDLPSTSQVGTSQRVDTSKDTVMDDASNQGRIIDEMDKDNVVAVMDDKEEDKKEEEAMVVEDDQEDEPAEVQEVVDVVTTAKLITEVVTAASETVTAASTIIFASEPQVTAATITAAPVRVAAATITVALVRVATASTRRRKGMVIRDPEEESATSSIIHADTKSKDKRKGIVVEDPKPLKKKQQVEMDEEYARKLHAELNKDIDWDVAIDHVKQKAKEDLTIQRFSSKDKRTYGREESRALQSINETPTQKAAKRRKLDKEVKDLKRHLEIMPDEDDAVYTKATPLARKPKNFSNDFLLNTLGAMFENPDKQAQVWKNQRSIHGQAKVKSWKLLESCGVHIITFSTTQLILLVERRYQLSRLPPQQHSKNLGLLGLRHCRKYLVGAIQYNHDEGKHERDLCIYPKPHETIHQTIVENVKFHYGDLLFLEGRIH
nr:ribonuclease H-like domain-containing protein [Tanacetum cinerariifolium]